MDAIIQNFFNIPIMTEAFPFLMRGLGTTALLCLAVIPLGLIGGLVLALMMGTKNRLYKWALICFVDFFRAVPPLVLLIFIYSGLPFAGINIPPFAAVCLG